MAIVLAAEATLHVGKPMTVEGKSPSQSYCVVFEDDGDTGYLYALDLQRQDNPIVDALHIYNVASVSDRNKPSVVQLGWSHDGLKAVLLINRYPHAIFNFQSCRGYCRTGFPTPSMTWSQQSHAWEDSAQELFR